MHPDLTMWFSSSCADYQMRIAYGTYKLIQKMPGGERHAAFTRILHRTARDPDPLADEIPTFRADPLQPECDDWCEYPVSDRANAVNQFWKYAQEAGLLREDWYYMIESDYVFIKPLDIPQGDDARKKAWGFSFSYIHPVAHPEEMKILYPGGDVNAIPRSGPAPILMTLDNWLRVTNDWEDMAAKIEANDAIKKKLGWVREMYGFSIAVVKNGIELDATEKDNRFIVQPPADDSLGQAHAFHYTQCTIFKTMDDKDVWGYDKRFHTDPSEALRVPKIDPVPPFKEGQWKFIEGNPVTRKHHESISMMIDQMNRAIDTLKPLKAAHRS